MFQAAAVKAAAVYHHPLHEAAQDHTLAEGLRPEKTGHGFGLSTVFRIVQNHKGAIHVDEATGTVYLAGTTQSTDFDTTAGAYSQTFSGSNDVLWGGRGRNVLWFRSSADRLTSLSG